MDYVFGDCVSLALKRATQVKLEDDIMKKIYGFVEKLIERKSQEQHHVVDNRKESKRFTTGFMGEAALEKVLGIPIIDWTIGNSDKYHVPDIPGYSVGIKTVEYGKFPIIFKKNDYPQIICIVDTNRSGNVYVCGLATIDVLNKYQDDSLILDDKLRARGTKTGFYGFDHITPIAGVIDLEPYKKPVRRPAEGYANAIKPKSMGHFEKICPECHRGMVLRDGRYGQFWGCTGYPRCKHTENA